MRFDVDEKTDGLVARGVHIVHMHVITSLLEYRKIQGITHSIKEVAINSFKFVFMIINLSPPINDCLSLINLP